MKLQIFQSYQGDCLLVEARSGHRMLCDGGTAAAMKTFVAPALERLHRNGHALDLVYVSHIDDDHIGGVLALLEAALDWRVYDYHAANGDAPREPEAPRVPEIRGLWHNAFHDQIGANTGAIRNLLAASARALRASHVDMLEQLGYEYARIATSVSQALRVSRLLKPDLLGIPLNRLEASPAHDGKLLMARAGMAPEALGSLRLHILSPTQAELGKLREGWNNWLRDPANRLKAIAIRERYLAGVQAITAGQAMNPFDLHDWEGIAAYEGVTTPNVASLVLLVEEDGKTLLLTGDSHPDMILRGLDDGGHLHDGAIHVDVLKVQHHGSENNMTEAFGRAVSADHYIFCGNGAHANPELSVLDAFLAARVGAPALRARAARARDRPFTFWFNTTPEAQTARANIEHMTRVRAWAEARLERYQPLLKVRFVDKASASLTV